jgi:soluble lytic murein transglycosylase
MRPVLLARCLPDFRRLTSWFLASFLLLSAVSCKAKPQSEGQKKFSNDADYFIGLRFLEEGNENAAREKFKYCIKKGSSACAQKSAEALCSIGNIQEKNAAAESLLQLFPGDESLLIAARQFSSSNEINKLIYYTSNLDFSTAKNEVIRLRLEAMGRRGDSAYESEVYRWFTECPLSTEHYQFYRDYYKHPDFEGAYENPESEAASSLKFTPQQFAINYRIESYKRNYSYTTKCAATLAGYFLAGTLQPAPQLVSDLGKNTLYGTMDFAKNAAWFGQMAENFAGTPAEFYFWFYAGRFYEKAGMYFQQSRKCFEAAMVAAASPSQKDNALWYLLNTSLNFSMDSIIESIGEYSREGTDSEYFEDFFEQLVTALLAAGRWNEFGRIYKAVDGYASDLTTAQFAYIYGRLIQEGLTEGTAEEAQEAFKRACHGGSSVYYKTLAAYRLGMGKDPVEIQKILTAPTAAKETNPTSSENPGSPTNATASAPDTALENLLLGYAYFGFPELIYPEWIKTQGQKLSTETNFYLSDFLAKCEGHETESLRIAARAQRNASHRITREQLAQVYPTFYKEYVSKYSEEYKISESKMFALIRSESFFDAEVMSSAGAVGLTQLMEFTGSDIARRFKIQDYSLTDPETNIRFGTWYLASLISRCDNSALLGFFSYNAGITRVRRWQKSSLIEFGKKSNMPLDLFLETVPFAETREYGRKLISATIAYDWLANPARFPQTVEELLK